MKTPVYKITLMVIDHDRLGPEGVEQVLENQRYPNWCIHPTVMDSQTRLVEWSDDHPLNRNDTADQAFEDLFMTKGEGENSLLFEVRRLVADKDNGMLTQHEFEVMLGELVRAAGV